MTRVLKALLVIALAVVLVAGVTAHTGCDSCGTDDIANGDTPNGDVTNGDTPNGDTPNGDEPNGDEPDEIAQPDFTSGLGLMLTCEEFDGSSFEEKDPAPVFTFQDASGQTFSLSDFKGRAVILNFWRTDCGWCVYEMPYIEEVYATWPAEELVILTIDIGEDAETVSDFLEEIDSSPPVILDREALVTMQYMVSSMPRTFFIDKEGLIRAIKFGAFQSLEDLEAALDYLITLQEEE